jgi:hypothetical protein
LQDEGVGEAGVEFSVLKLDVTFDCIQKSCRFKRKGAWEGQDVDRLDM